MAYACAGDYARPYPLLCQCPSKMGADENSAAHQAGIIQKTQGKVCQHQGHEDTKQRNYLRKRRKGLLGNWLLLWNSWSCLSRPGSTLHSGADETAKEGLETL